MALDIFFTLSSLFLSLVITFGLSHLLFTCFPCGLNELNGLCPYSEFLWALSLVMGTLKEGSDGISHVFLLNH